MLLTANDYANALALINRASLQGHEVEGVAALKAKLVKAHKFAEQTESGVKVSKNYDPADLPMGLGKTGDH